MTTPAEEKVLQILQGIGAQHKQNVHEAVRKVQEDRIDNLMENLYENVETFDHKIDWINSQMHQTLEKFRAARDEIMRVTKEMERTLEVTRTSAAKKHKELTEVIEEYTSITEQLLPLTEETVAQGTAMLDVINKSVPSYDLKEDSKTGRYKVVAIPRQENVLRQVLASGTIPSHGLQAAVIVNLQRIIQQSVVLNLNFEYVKNNPFLNLEKTLHELDERMVAALTQVPTHEDEL